jgi:hypothetical protein
MRGGFRNNYQKRYTPRDQAGAGASAAAAPAEKKQYPTEPNFAVTKNGALGLYNVTRRPIIFYANQWEGVRAMIENGALTQALADNADKLKRLPAKTEGDAAAEEAEVAHTD